MHRTVRAAASLSALFLLASCTKPERPEPPSILRDVAMIDDDVEFTHPFVPGHRTTMDGRIAIRVQGGPPGTYDLSHNLSFTLFAPERLDEPIMSGPPGALIQAEPVPFDVPFPPAMNPAVTRLGHHAICDATRPFPEPGEQPNPQPCGAGGLDDCYRFTVISSTSESVLGVQMWGTPVTIEVANPKTASARIIRAELAEPVAGTFIPLMNEWTEPAVTRDGRLLTGRWGRAPRAWTNPETGETKVRFYDLAYSVLPEDAAPCDVTKWTLFHPISHAPFDPHMIGRYGLAAYPFRDAEGNPIADGEDVSGTYPWVDRDGTNVFMAGVQGRLSEQSSEEYPRRCVVDGCDSYEQSIDWDRGFMAGGLWTHGKFVHLDGLINNLDWAVGVTPRTHYKVDLYRDASGEDVQVRFGSGRFIDGRERDEGGPYPPGYTHNPNIVDSVMNLFNYDPDATPITPRDVVWLMSNGVGSEEIVFDDYVDPNAFIVSNMQASITPHYNPQGETVSVPKYWNGQVRTVLLGIGQPQFNVLAPDLVEDIHVENAATSLGCNVPSFGRVAAGTGRIEPVALGGIQGKGFWLTGTNSIRYPVPAQTRSVTGVSWYVGVFLDPRGDDGEARTVARFPDGSELRVAGHATAQYTLDGAVVHEVPLPPGSGWLHLALAIGDQNRVITLLHDGFPLDRFTSPGPLFVMSEGELVVGDGAAAAAGFRGWIDDLHVLAHGVDAEVACNQAHGTLVRIDANSQLAAASDAYPEWAHHEIASAAGEPASGARYWCHHDYSDDYAAHLANLPAGTTSVRRPINFPEGPLRAGAPRPDSSQNAFCLTCHSAHAKGGLTLAALESRPDVTAENDHRRQPLQPPRRVFGNIPAHWIAPGAGPGSPGAALQAPPEGLLIDEWVLAGATDTAASLRAIHRH
ncbi:MAG: hypothetical protein IPK07_19400 [Deltaproteobacteria bacterium]|nr:hypothetical protein [Deltaproteobacteria bacterium]